MIPNKKQLYRLPWSANDNPIGWVEITDICNIHCDGCYRLVMGEGHKPLEQVKDEILFLKKWRNCDGISLAGGEPILHPQIVEIIQFIKSQGMKSLILTNGYALDKNLLGKLRKAGLTGLSFHIDTTQKRPEFKKIKPEQESEMNALRTACAEKLKQAGSFYSHFGITVTRKNLHEVPGLLEWARDNMHVVNGISLITYRGIPATDGIEFRDSSGQKIPMKPGSLGYSISLEELANCDVTASEVYAVIKKHFPEYEATAYLGGTVDHSSFKWLIGNFIVNKRGKIFGAYGSRTMELVQVFYHLTRGKYLVYPKVKMGKRVFIMSLFDRTVRKGLIKFLGYCLGNPLRFFIPVKAIGIGIIQAPDVMPDGRIDMCDDCPDMCVYNGTLVNSCRLDECRKFGCMLQINVTSEEISQMIARTRSSGKVESGVPN